MQIKNMKGQKMSIKKMRGQKVNNPRGRYSPFACRCLVYVKAEG